MSIFSLFKINKGSYAKEALDGRDYFLSEKDSLITDKEEVKNFEEKLHDPGMFLAEENKCPYYGSIQKETLSDNISCSFCHENIRVADSYLEASKNLILSEDDLFQIN